MDPSSTAVVGARLARVFVAKPAAIAPEALATGRAWIRRHTVRAATRTGACCPNERHFGTEEKDEGEKRTHGVRRKEGEPEAAAAADRPGVAPWACRSHGDASQVREKKSSRGPEPRRKIREGKNSPTSRTARYRPRGFEQNRTPGRIGDKKPACSYKRRDRSVPPFPGLIRIAG